MWNSPIQGLNKTQNQFNQNSNYPFLDSFSRQNTKNKKIYDEDYLRGRPLYDNYEI